MSEAAHNAPPAPANALVPGVSFFQVLVPGPLLNAAGDRSYEMHGPFPTLGAASQFAQSRPGALITVTLVLHEAPQISAQLAAQLATLGKS